MSQELAPKNQTQIEKEGTETVMGVLKKYERTFKGVLPKHMTPDRWGWLVVNSLRKTPALADCTTTSFFNAVLLAANMGLEIRQNSAYLIPYGKECQLIIDYRGKLELVRRAGVGEVAAELVHEIDDFEYAFDASGRKFRHSPKLLAKKDGRLVPVGDRGEVVLGYAAGKINGGWQLAIMTLDEIEKVRRRAKSGAGVAFNHYGKQMPGLTLQEIRAKDVVNMSFKDPYRLPWVTDWDAMAKKTLVHRLCNMLPMTEQLLLSQQVDTAAETGDAMPMAPAFQTVAEEIDPADDRPLVLGGGDREEQKAAQADVLDRELSKRGLLIPAQIETLNKAAAAHPQANIKAILGAAGYEDVKQVKAKDFEEILAAVQA